MSVGRALPPHQCQHPGCPRLIYGRASRCDDHAARRHAWRRSYEWQSLRAAQLARHPFCEWPECMRKATEVNHRNGNSRDNRPANLESLCHPHHASKTAADSGFSSREFYQWS